MLLRGKSARMQFTLLSQLVAQSFATQTFPSDSLPSTGLMAFTCLAGEWSSLPGSCGGFRHGAGSIWGGTVPMCLPPQLGTLKGTWGMSPCSGVPCLGAVAELHS